MNVTRTARPFLKVNCSTFKQIPKNKVKKEQVALNIEDDPNVVYFNDAFIKYKPMKYTRNNLDAIKAVYKQIF